VDAQDELLKEASFEGKTSKRDITKLDLPARLRFRFVGCMTQGHTRSWRQLEHDHAVLGLALSNEGGNEYLYSCSRDRTIRKWSLADGSLVHALLGHTSMVRCIAVNSSFVASGGDDRKVRVWERDRPHLLRAINAHDDFVRAVALCSCNPEHLVSAGDDRKVIKWNAATGERLQDFSYDAVVTALAIYECSLLTGGSDGQMRMWHSVRGNLLAKLKHPGAVTALSLL